MGEASTSATVTDDDEDDIPLPSAKRRRTRYKLSDQRKVTVTPRRSARLHPAQRPSSSSSRSTTSSQRVAVVEIPSPAISVLGSPETTGDEDDIIVTSPTSRKRPQKAPKDNFVVDDDRVDYYSSEQEVVTPSKSRRRAQNKRGDDFVVNDDRVEYVSSEDEPVTPLKRQKLSRSQISPQKELRRIAELEEDLEDLVDSDNVIIVKKNRTRGAPVNKARDETRKHLEILRRRRAGEKVPHITAADEEDDDYEPIDIDRAARDRPRYSLSSAQSSTDSSEDSDPPAETTNDDDEDDFIDDTAEHLGLPHPDIPLEFTSYASRKPRELFVHVIDWLVKNKISPAFDRHDPLWDLAFKKLDDEVKGQAGSRLISAAWNEPFVRTLKARPGVTAVRLPGDENDYIRTCDACNHTNHPAQYDFQFTGKAYYHKTLEPVDNSDDEDEDNENENDAGSVDSKDHVLPSAHQHFYLGRYCAANAEMGHKLSHWLFHLNQNLLAYLEEQGVLSPEKIIARDKKNHTKREREAEMIVDTMRETGVVDDLWRDFKSDMDDARIGMDGFEKKGGRGKARIGSIRMQRQDDEGEVMWERDVHESKYREAPKLFDESD
jgi:hypothetical protein